MCGRNKLADTSLDVVVARRSQSGDNSMSQTDK